jgi:hypothetical protein
MSFFSNPYQQPKSKEKASHVHNILFLYIKFFTQRQYPFVFKLSKPLILFILRCQPPFFSILSLYILSLTLLRFLFDRFFRDSIFIRSRTLNPIHRNLILITLDLAHLRHLSTSLHLTLSPIYQPHCMRLDFHGALFVLTFQFGILPFCEG